MDKAKFAVAKSPAAFAALQARVVVVHALVEATVVSAYAVVRPAVASVSAFRAALALVTIWLEQFLS